MSKVFPDWAVKTAATRARNLPSQVSCLCCREFIHPQKFLTRYLAATAAVPAPAPITAPTTAGGASAAGIGSRACLLPAAKAASAGAGAVGTAAVAA